MPGPPRARGRPRARAGRAPGSRRAAAPGRRRSRARRGRARRSAASGAARARPRACRRRRSRRAPRTGSRRPTGCRIGQSGSSLAGLVVVGDDHLDPGVARRRDLGDRADPAVGRDQQRGPALGEPLDRRRASARSRRSSRPGISQSQSAPSSRSARDQDRGRADPVDVVVAVDRDPPPGRDRRRGSARRPSAIAVELERVVVVRGVEEARAPARPCGSRGGPGSPRPARRARARRRAPAPRRSR